MRPGASSSETYWAAEAPRATRIRCAGASRTSSGSGKIVARALQHVLMFLEWDAIRDAGVRSAYAAEPALAVHDQKVAAGLVEANSGGFGE